MTSMSALRCSEVMDASSLMLAAQYSGGIHHTRWTPSAWMVFWVSRVIEEMSTSLSCFLLEGARRQGQRGRQRQKKA